MTRDCEARAPGRNIRRCDRSAGLIAALFTAALCGCAGVRHPSDDVAAPGTGSPATVRVENQRYADLVIFVLRRSQQMQLGTVNGESSTTFALPLEFANPTAPIRLVAAPIGGRALPISDAVTVYPGDKVDLVIAPY